MSFDGFVYQAIGVAPCITDYSEQFKFLEDAVKFTKVNFDISWVIQTPFGLRSDTCGLIPTATRLAKSLADLHNKPQLSFYLDNGYIQDRSPLPTNQQGGLHAVLVTWEDGRAKLDYSYWCVTMELAKCNLRRDTKDCRGYKAIVAGPYEIYDAVGNLANTELYESVKGIMQH